MEDKLPSNKQLLKSSYTPEEITNLSRRIYVDVNSDTVELVKKYDVDGLKVQEKVKLNTQTLLPVSAIKTFYGIKESAKPKIYKYLANYSEKTKGVIWSSPRSNREVAVDITPPNGFINDFMIKAFNNMEVIVCLANRSK